MHLYRRPDTGVSKGGGEKGKERRIERYKRYERKTKSVVPKVKESEVKGGGGNVNNSEEKNT